MANANDPARAERNRDILIDRKNGFTYPELAEKYELSLSTVHGIVAKYVEDAIKPAADELRQFEIERLEQYKRALQPRIDRGEPRAIEVAIKVGESLRKLTGIDATTKIEVEHTASAATLVLQARLNKAHESHVDETE
jgi:transposase